jgi:hypothetical protein
MNHWDTCSSRPCLFEEDTESGLFDGESGLAKVQHDENTLRLLFVSASPMLSIGLVDCSQQLAKAGRKLHRPQSRECRPKQPSLTLRKQRNGIDCAVFFISGHLASPRYERGEAAEEPRVSPQVRGAEAARASYLPPDAPSQSD